MKIETSKHSYSISLDLLELICTGKISALETDIRICSVKENYIFSENISLTRTTENNLIGINCKKIKCYTKRDNGIVFSFSVIG